jgi:hypothetical protein
VSAIFLSPRALAIGSTGIVYVADANRVRALTCAAFSLTATASPSPSAGATRTTTPSATPTPTALPVGCVVVTVAGECKSAVCKEKHESTVTHAVTVRHVGANCHRQHCKAGPDIRQAHAERLRRPVFIPHAARSQLSDPDGLRFRTRMHL